MFNQLNEDVVKYYPQTRTINWKQPWTCSQNKMRIQASQRVRSVVFKSHLDSRSEIWTIRKNTRRGIETVDISSNAIGNRLMR